MSSIRAFELAKELGVPIPSLKKEAKAVGVTVKGPLAALKDAEAEAIRNRFRAPQESAAMAKPQATAKKRKKAVSTKSAKSKIAEASVKASARVAPSTASETLEELVPPPPPVEEVVEVEEAPVRPVRGKRRRREEDGEDYTDIVEAYIPPPAVARRPSAPAVAPPAAPRREEEPEIEPEIETEATPEVAAEVAAEVAPAEVLERIAEAAEPVEETPVARPRRQQAAVPPPAAASAPPAPVAVPPAEDEAAPAAAAPQPTVAQPPRPAAASADEGERPAASAEPERKGPGMVRPAAPRPERDVEPSLDRRYVPQPLEVYEAGPRPLGGKRKKKAKDRRKEAAAETAGGRRAFSLDLGADFVSSRVTKKREKAKDSKSVEVTIPCTLKDLSASSGIRVNELMGRLMRTGLMVSINDIIDKDIVEVIGVEFDLEIKIKEAVELTQDDLLKAIEGREEDRMPRAPIVTFLGHVDHGKTSLLDKIRSASVASAEAGGITQHITAYRIDRDNKKVVFVDTPGHAAFSSMRARGANITDVVVLVVAADDGPMPQTEEAIAHARAAEVPIVVAINKTDKAEANVMLTKQKLSALGLQPEEWGGNTVMVEVSATTGDGIDDLLEYLTLESELLELTANPMVPASGTVLEARRTEGRGIVADVLVQNGTLRRGDVLLAGSAFGRVKQLFDTSWKPIKEAGPATPVWVTGLGEIPDAGERFVCLDDITDAQDRAEKQRLVRRQKELATKRRRHASLESLFADLSQSESRELLLIVKADVAGSLEAIKSEIAKLDGGDITVRIIHSAAGGITEGDIALADASDAVVIGFHVTTEERARALMKARGVEVRQYSIIYQILDDLKAAMEGMLEPDEVVEIIGHAEVRQTFRASRVGTIAGCRVTDGVIKRTAFVRVARNNIIVFPSDETVRRATLGSLKRFKEDAREVKEGFECGIKIEGYDDIKEGDVFECYEIKKVKRKLDV